MNKIKINGLICTSLSVMILGTTVFIGGIPKVNAYAADSTNVGTVTATSGPMVGAGTISGEIRAIEYANDTNYYGNVMIVTIMNEDQLISYFAKTDSQVAEELRNAAIGQTITINYVTGTPVRCNDKYAFPISSVETIPNVVGAGKTVGTLKSIQNVNDTNYYGNVIVATISYGDEDYSYFAQVGTQAAEDLKNIAIGQNVTINYVTGTPIQSDSKYAFPMTAISTTTINKTTYTDSQGVIYQFNENDNTATISSQTSIGGDIVIPQQITANGKQYTVTVIGADAFGKCSNLKSIVIPDSVTRIGQYAFYGCTNIESVTLPNNLTAVEERTFSGCSSLKSIILPESVKDIGCNAFYGCDSLLSITIPSSLTFIGNNTADRLSYVNTFIMKQNNNNFTTEDGAVFSRENPAVTATPIEPDYREICGVGNCSGTIKSKKYIQYDYSENGTYEEYLILTITDYKGDDSSFFTEKNSNECNEIEKANIGQHIELVCTTGTPIFDIDSNGNCAEPLSSLLLATSTETPATSTVATSTETPATTTVATSTETVATSTVATSTETVATSTIVASSTETVATSTAVATGTETATSTTAATSTETSATSTTVEAGTGTTTGGNAKTGDAASLMTVAMFMAGSAGIMLKKGKK